MKFTSTDKAPAALGPYSQAVSVNGLLFTSGQIALDPATGEIVGSDVQAQAEQVCKNLAAVLEANGLTFTDAVKTTCLWATSQHSTKFTANTSQASLHVPA